jgi:hypothetical protein
MSMRRASRAGARGGLPLFQFSPFHTDLSQAKFAGSGAKLRGTKLSLLGLLAKIKV